MTDIVELYQLAENHEHEVYWYTDENISAVSVMDETDGSCAIAINPFKIEGNADEKYKLAHELGHCECGAFYNRYSPFDLVNKHEFRADRWAIKKLLPKEELRAAIVDRRDRCEIAEMFEVPVELVDKAVEYYIQMESTTNSSETNEDEAV